MYCTSMAMIVARTSHRDPDQQLGWQFDIAIEASALFTLSVAVHVHYSHPASVLCI